ncbi:MAG: hypothetical protein FJX54_21165 [Alphaproteobacteria bacterium]|nr:hypothetical protein [Alphaproteobacteria bacterium]
MAVQADALMRRAIERRLTPSDLYRTGDDLGVILFFPALVPQEARSKCAQLGEELAGILSAEFRAEMQVDSAAAAGDPKTLLAVIRQEGDLAEAVVAEIERASSPAAHVLPLSRLDQVRFLFRPIWNVKRNAVFNFLCVPVTKSPGGRVVSGESAVEGLDDRHVRMDYDLRLLRRVVDEFMRVEAQDRRLLFTIPVHVDTVTSTAFRSEYVKLWRTLPLSLQRLAIFDLVGGSDGFPQSRLIEILPTLKPASRGVTLRMPLPATHSLPRFAHVGLHAISAEAPQGREESLAQDFEKFVIAAEKAHLLTYLHGIRTGSLAVAAVGAGFSFIDGPAIGSAEANPKDALRFSMEDLYAKR